MNLWNFPTGYVVLILNMKNKSVGYTIITVFLSLLAFSGFAIAQTAQSKLTETILAKDAAFWVAYNKCDTTGFRQFFTGDVEFYHDKGGPTIGLDNFVNTLKTNICGDPDSRLRREAVQGTVKVFLLKKSKVIYGAIISGEHVF